MMDNISQEKIFWELLDGIISILNRVLSLLLDRIVYGRFGRFDFVIILSWFQ